MSRRNIILLRFYLFPAIEF